MARDSPGAVGAFAMDSYAARGAGGHHCSRKSRSRPSALPELRERSCSAAFELVRISGSAGTMRREVVRSKMPAARLDTADGASRNLVPLSGSVVRHEIRAPSHIAMAARYPRPTLANRPGIRRRRTPLADPRWPRATTQNPLRSRARLSRMTFADGGFGVCATVWPRRKTRRTISGWARAICPP